MSENGSIDLDKERLALDKEKLLLETRKFESEEKRLTKQAQSDRNFKFLNAFAIFIPLMVAAITLATSLATQYQQAQNELSLKIADIVLQANGPTEALHRANALKALLPNFFDKNFAASFDPKQFTSNSMSINTALDLARIRLDLLKLMVEHSDQKAEIITIWNSLSTGEELQLLDISNATDSASSNPSPLSTPDTVSTPLFLPSPANIIIYCEQMTPQPQDDAQCLHSDRGGFIP